MIRSLAAAGYLYDTSRPNADFFRNGALSNNGCGTMFPFLEEGLVILPITLPQDAMRENLGMAPQEFWEWVLALVEIVKAMGGMAVITTHTQPHLTANPPMLEGYEMLLRALSSDRDAWKPLPRAAAAWSRWQLS
jgi:hypothetical protein